MHQKPYAPKRPKLSQKHRKSILEHHNSRCWICGQPIADGEEYDVDHQVPRELGGSDAPDNLAPAHKPCHRHKTKQDVAAIAKSNRIRRRLDGTRRARKKIKSNPKIQSRPFNTKGKPNG